MNEEASHSGMADAGEEGAIVSVSPRLLEAGDEALEELHAGLSLKASGVCVCVCVWVCVWSAENSFIAVTLTIDLSSESVMRLTRS